MIASHDSSFRGFPLIFVAIGISVRRCRSETGSFSACRYIARTCALSLWCLAVARCSVVRPCSSSFRCVHMTCTYFQILWEDFRGDEALERRIRTFLNASLKEQPPFKLLTELSDDLPPHGRRALAHFIAQCPHCDIGLEQIFVLGLEIMYSSSI
jgi:hypothetical protein